MLEELKSFGLSEKESLVYLSCLKLGSSTANRITSNVNIPRTTVYEILERLKSLGLMSTVISEHKTNFIACDPKRFIDLLEEKKSSIQKILPELKNIQNKVGAKPFAEVFEGNNSVFKIFDEILEKPNSELKIIGSMENAINQIGFRTDRFRTIRKDKKIKVTQILEKSEEALSEREDKLTEVRCLKSLKDSKEVIFILNSSVYHVILHHQIYAIKIESKEHAKTMEILFDSLWRIARYFRQPNYPSSNTQSHHPSTSTPSKSQGS